MSIKNDRFLLCRILWGESRRRAWARADLGRESEVHIDSVHPIRCLAFQGTEFARFARSENKRRADRLAPDNPIAVPKEAA